MQTVVIPVSYDPARNNNNAANIALLLLSDASAAAPPRLAAPADAALLRRQRRFAAAGWGYTSESRRVMSASLQWVWLNAVSAATCRDMHEDYRLGALPADQFCAGWTPVSADVCVGDYGGPLLVPGRSVGVPGAPREDLLVGVVSYGPKYAACGGDDNLGLYTSVSYWGPWIRDSLSLYNMRK